MLLRNVNVYFNYDFDFVRIARVEVRFFYAWVRDGWWGYEIAKINGLIIDLTGSFSWDRSNYVI